MFKTIKSILFATDLSPNCRAAFEVSISLAAQYQAKLVLLHVVAHNVPSFIEGHIRAAMGDEKWEALAMEHQQDARHTLIGKMKNESLLHTALKQYCADGGIDDVNCGLQAYEIVVAEGEIIQQVLAQAANHQCDIIVIGARKGFLKSNSIGPTAKGVMRQTRIPVLFVPPLAGDEF
jgi:nucleotide-binding universal stress UspA family protein